MKVQGVPNIKWFGKCGDNYCMVIPLLGISLMEFGNKSEDISMEIVAHIGAHLCDVLQDIHEKKLIHQDIKPSNLLFDTDIMSIDDATDANAVESNVFLIDFGFCKAYIGPDDRHIQPMSTSGVIGTPNYTSIHSHQHMLMSRRDDMESAAYILLFLCVGELYWATESSNETILQMKLDLVRNPTEFLKYFDGPEPPRQIIETIAYAQQLGFDEIPDYEHVAGLIAEIAAISTIPKPT